VFCSNCGNELLIEHKFCSGCGNQKNSDKNSISSGDKSVNTIGSEIVGSNIHIGDNYNDTNNIDPKILNFQRHFVKLPWSKSGKLSSRSSIFKLGTWGSIASIVALALPYFTSLNYLPHLFFIGLGVSMSLLMLTAVLKKLKFTHFQGLKNLENGNKDGVYVTRITCDCPWCTDSEMKLRLVGPKDNKEHLLLCERNPSQHRIIFDPTVLPDIEE